MEGRKNLARRAKVRELIETLSPADIGTRLGISRQRVYQILADEEIDYLPLNRWRRRSGCRADLINSIVRKVSELSARTSPDYAPDMLLVREFELRQILEDLLP